MERVELHMHTKLSDDISVIDPIEALQCAIEHSHKAIAFTNLNNVQDFPAVFDAHKKLGRSDIKVIYGAELRYEKEHGNSYGITVLSKNSLGIKELYKIISSICDNGNCDLADLDVIIKNRQNLLIGSCGNNGELYEKIASGQNLKEIAEFYDYFEIYPAADKNERTIYKKIYELGAELGIPVVATGNCHYLNQKDEICRRIVQVVNGRNYENKKLFYHTTEEMLAEFSYLGEDAAYQAVIANPNKIADSITQVSPLKEGYYPPVIDDAYEQIEKAAYAKAKNIYGLQLPVQIAERINAELTFIKKHGYATDYVIALHMVKNMNGLGYHVGTKDSVGAVLIAFLLGISDVNPLPAHYYCPHCYYVDFQVTASDGFDLTNQRCPVCGCQLQSDGHNIPFEIFMGCDGSKRPNIKLYFPGSQIYDEFAFLQKLFGENKIAYAGTVSTLREKTAQYYISAYESQTGESFAEGQRGYICEKLCGIKRDDSVLPGGLIILPQEKNFEDFTPLREVRTPSSIKKATHFDYRYLHDTVKKFDVLGHNTPDMLKLLEDSTGTSVQHVTWNDPKLYSLFKHSDTQGIPEFDTDFMKDILLKLEPKSFDELVKISGLVLGAGIWHNNAEDLLNSKHNLDELPIFRDDVFMQLMQYGLERNAAYKIAECVSDGILYHDNADTFEFVAHMRNKNVPEWYIQSLCKVRYLSSKAHSVAYVMNAVRMAWYKAYYPTQFNTACFTAEQKK